MKLASFDPATGDLVGEVDITPVDQIPAIVARARAAFPAWRDLGAVERGRILAQSGPVFLERAVELGTLLTTEMGKPLREGIGEVKGCGRGLNEEIAEMIEAFEPEEHGSGKAKTMLYRDPLGVAAAITPWNYPISMPHWLVLPALMAGNTVVLKPSEETPLIAQAYADVLNQFLPEGVLQVIHGDGDQGRALVAADVNLISFTGSRAAGQHILAAAAGSLKRVLLELGGKDPLIVLDDADAQAAGQFAAGNAFRNAGQVCVSTERIYVQHGIADAFEAAFAEAAKSFNVGHGLAEGTTIGPMIHRRQRDLVIGQVKDALQRGGRLMFGGDDLEVDAPFLHPMAVTDVPDDAPVVVDETFGPVAVVRRVGDDDDAVALANASIYGLGAVVFGGDQARARQVARRLDAGMVGINRGVGGAPGTPWVGAKQSGYGFHHGKEGHRQFTQVRIITEST